MKLPTSLKLPGKTAPPPARVETPPPGAAHDEEGYDPFELPAMTTLRENLPPSTALVVLLAMIGGAGYATYVLAIQGTADNNTGAMWADLGILGAGFLILWWLGTFAWLGDRIPIGPLGLLPEPAGVRDDSMVGTNAVEHFQRQSGAHVRQLVEHLIYDYGQMMVGEVPELAYATQQVRTALSQAVAPILRSGERIRPAFSDQVDVSIDWNTQDVLRPVTATAYFIDQSTRIAESGMGVQMPRRRMRIIAAFNHQLTQIIDATIGPV